MKNRLLMIVCFAALIPPAFAEQGRFVNSGGSLAGGSPVAIPAGTLTISGNYLTFLTTDGTTAINHFHHKFHGRKLLGRRQGRPRDV